MTWFEAVEFANRRSLRAGLTPAYTISGTNVTWNRGANGYRLPTEAEWEFAARAGTTTQWSFGDTNGNIDYYAWTNRNSNGMTREVGGLGSNDWGLYDMHGNVWEWVWDRWGALDANPATNPTGAAAGGLRVLRGGGLSSVPVLARSAHRDGTGPVNRDGRLGLRVARP